MDVKKCWPILIIAGVLAVFPLSAVTTARSVPATAGASPSVLLIYDSLGRGTPKEGNMEALQRLLAAFGAEVTVTTFERYAPGTLSRYEYAVAVRNARDLPSSYPEFEHDFTSYAGRYMHVGMHLPERVVEALELREEQASGGSLTLTVGQLSEASIRVENIGWIRQAAGESYGSWSSSASERPAPFGVMNGGYAYIPYVVPGNLTELGSSYVLKDWLSVQGQSRYYAAFREIYPFSDLDRLKRLSDRLYEAGIPFIASVQPVLSNLDYPAVQRYLEALKHIQSRNGSIVVNAPVVASTISQDITTLKDELSAFVDALADYGIAPLGIGAEMYWTYDRHYKENALSSFDSILMFPNKRIMHRERTDTSQPFASSLYTLSLEDLQSFRVNGKVPEPLPMDTALLLELPGSEKQMEETVQALRSDWRAFADYKTDAHTVRTAANEIRSRGGLLQVNGRTLALGSAAASIEEQHTYIQEGPKSFASLFTVQNNIFIVLIALTLLIFGGFLILGYRLYKRKYMHQEKRP
ncbi:Uncharacterized protein YdaL [Paenibacillus sp. UNCCL117]|uniref:hypothetical protein n=1 Tax=unclassified Paenibacillus TaxID=185978 RepID=UPI000882A215|nr:MULTISPECIES: hypothetical protein [unclassified Paenibacillus]SDC17437.1 Uncharacterized protein YdaL [Paenibacillus sp. cl123]SFW18009.1 Uncharacterized protein YdaL [Paenibacillus sp. UNCCL117]